MIKANEIRIGNWVKFKLPVDEVLTYIDWMDIKDIYDGFKRRAFIYAMLYIFDKPQFEFTEFLQKLKNQPSALTDCNDTKQYITLIEEIYNYRRREKVNLRF